MSSVSCRDGWDRQFNGRAAHDGRSKSDCNRSINWNGKTNTGQSALHAYPYIAEGHFSANRGQQPRCVTDSPIVQHSGEWRVRVQIDITRVGLGRTRISDLATNARGFFEGFSRASGVREEINTAGQHVQQRFC